MSSAKPAKPPTYSGSRDPEVVEAWIYRMDTYLTVTGTPAKDKVVLASTYLDGTALHWFISSRTDLTTYDLFKSGLKAQFIPANYESVLFSRFQSTKQGTKTV